MLMVTVFRRIMLMLTQQNSVDLPPIVKNNEKVLRCPCCGNKLSIDAVYLKEDPRHNVKIVERALSCKACKIRIRQYVYLW